MIRPSTAKGNFYPANPKKLEQTLQQCFIDANGHDFQINKTKSKSKIIGGVTPHAGYDYSCSIAAKTYQKMMEYEIPDTVIVLGFHHQGYGNKPINALMTNGMWETPLGQIPIDQQIATEIANYIPFAEENDAFIDPIEKEHNIEVQLPFLQYAAKKAKKTIQFVPISINDTKETNIDAIGDAISEIIQKHPEKTIKIIASTDMSHERPRDPIQPSLDIELQREKDQEFITLFEQKNWKKLLQKGHFSTICGPQTMAALVNIGNKLGYRDIKTLGYTTSCEHAQQPICDYSVGYYAGTMEED